MNSNGNILIIEDDQDDRDFIGELIHEVLKENNFTNKVIFMNDGIEALEYMQVMVQKPFMIISDINMPKMSGFELRSIIFEDERLSSLCVPYIFLTTSGYHKEYLEQAYKLSIQGYFNKPNNPEEYKKMLCEIICYWKRSITPAQ